MEKSQIAGISDSDDPAEPEPPALLESGKSLREGTLLWLESLDHVDVDGRSLPTCHRIPAGSHWRSDADRGGKCALVRPDGAPCRAPATRRYGVCLVHCGGGSDPSQLVPLAAAANTRLRLKRELLGIGPASAGNPRQVARLRAAARADDLAAALLAPLDDRKLGAAEKQRAAIAAMDATYPIQATTLELDIPADPADMDWRSMQALAQRLLTSS